MTQVTVQQLAEVVGTPVDKLLEQLNDAGLSFSKPEQVISDSEKLQLLEHLRQNRGVKLGNASEGKKITLRRKSTSQLKVSGGQGRSATTKTVNVEVRRKKTYVKRSDLLEEQEQKRKQEEELEEQRLAEQRKAQEEKEKEEQAKREAEEAEAKRLAEEEAAKKAELEAKPEPSAPVVEPPPQAPAKEKKSARKKGASERNTQTKREELHVASDKRGRRKTSPKSRPQRTVETSSKHGFERPTAPVVRGS